MLVLKMSLRALGHHVFKHGANFIRNIRSRREFHSTNIFGKINVAQGASATPQQVSNPAAQWSVPRNFVLRNVGAQIGLQARRILIDNVLNRVTNSLASDLRKRAARRILYGDSGPFFALVGISLASGTGILTKEEELEGVCWEIREAVSKINWNFHDVDICNAEISLKDVSVGKRIGGGATAVVYSAKIKNQELEPQTPADLVESLSNDNVNGNDSATYPLALKMMYNYDIQSNAMAILRGMYRETVPARIQFNSVSGSDWEIELANRKRYLPPHPNIVAMFSIFADYVPELENCRNLYPAALPARIFAEGEGRNMSLFLLMKRYNVNLKEYMETASPSMRTSILLFSQLLEGVAHLTAHGIAHRDLKSDNLLLDLTEVDVPVLVISDFGCCLADKANGLHLPYTSNEIDIGGNAALMAPEIYTQRPGRYSVLDYTKSDLWTAGAVAYEIFQCDNPFYGKYLKNSTYKEDELPDLPAETPDIVRALVRNILERNPRRRLDSDVAANVCQLFLWAPSGWLKPGILKLPSSAEILQWLLSLTTKVLCEGRMASVPVNNEDSEETNQSVYRRGRRSYPEYLLISSFLRRASIANIRSALSWIQNNVFEVEY